MPISFSQRIAWAVREDSPELLEAVNNWLEMMKNSPDFYVIYNKYFKSPKSYQRRVKSEFYSLSGSKISPYDENVKKYANEINWDWRLLCSQIFQESRFDPNVESWAGAQGLMQLMPATAAQYSVKNVNNPVESIRAGTHLLDDLMDYWQNRPDSSERVKFVLASYNAGPGHVIDARALAEKYKKDKDQWKYVGEYLRKKSLPEFYNDEVVKHGNCRGEEPYNYVNDILKRYEHYKKFISDNAGQSES